MIKLSSISEKGNVRSNNEDRVGYFINKNIYLGILCDGMGGHKNGDIAANTALNMLAIDFMNSFKYINKDSVKEFVHSSFSNIKNELKKISSMNPDKKNMGTTVVAFIYNEKEKQLNVFYSGDSRCYILKRNNELIQVTRDHNLMNRWIDEGIDPKIDESMPIYRFLTSAVGANLETRVDFITIDDVEKNELHKVLLTSDGIHEFLSNDDIHFILSRNEEPNYIMQKFIEKAIIMESTDNMSAVLMEINNE
ncbi:PP2C family protein-serine/threonine phosphatase [Mycoplasmopsis canis]|nr:PP2C family serine/threonine-protein phosphatase [Mycoplasmopsis canis]AKF41317.1 protein phosphatase [Mycoplasmopsis canis]AMD81433.1 protein phosphatase [Mycoplasmopsis canis PG 14]EIE39395.1 protein phosphatase [Mycoplasmopsis canis UF33]EIE39546.1 protein phosphatase [Mycoplasmopsis canis PG 14]WQQ12169.1 PP2C family serine/threonine-protein phosphatase [Mycoplasmopsis canis]